jgi:probable O-glycosylation ligase (exosortase A-associated)
VKKKDDTSEKGTLRASPGREIFTLSTRNYVTHYQIRTGLLLLAIILMATLIGLMLLQLSARAAFAMAGILIFSAVLAVYPFVGLFGQIWLYFYPFHIWEGPDFLRPIFLMTAITMIFFIFNSVFIKKMRIRFPAECKLALLFLLFLFISSFFAVHSSSVSFSQNLIAFKVLLFYFLIINLVRSKKELNAFLWFILGCTALSALETIRFYRFYGVPRVDTVGGVQGGANALAAILVLTLPIVFYKMSSRNIYEKVIAGGLLLAFLAAVILTGSRGGTLGLLAVLVLLVWRFRRKRRSLLILTLIILVSALVAPSHYWARTQTIIDHDRDLSAQNRIDLWKAGLHMYSDHPYTGVGQGNYRYISPRYTELYYPDWRGGGFVAHNMFIDLLAEGGVQTLLAFLLFVGWTFRELRRARRRLPPSSGGEDLRGLATALEIGFIGFMVCGFFLSGLFRDVFFWLLALGPVIAILADRESARWAGLKESGGEGAAMAAAAGRAAVL